MITGLVATMFDADEPPFVSISADVMRWDVVAGDALT